LEELFTGLVLGALRGSRMSGVPEANLAWPKCESSQVWMRGLRGALTRAAAWRALLGGMAAAACTQPKPETLVIPPPPPAASCDNSVPSCQDPADATKRISCCDTLPVPGGPFKMGFPKDTLPTVVPETRSVHDVTVSTFFLDRFEITRGRFERFAEAGSGPPADGSGRHPSLDGSGWNTQWDEYLAEPRALLADPDCAPPAAPAQLATSRAEPEDAGSASELDYPMGCLSWFTAFAFCIWDGGRLPTEAEWEYAARGPASRISGDQPARIYPWGSDPAPVSVLANAGWEPVGSHDETRGFFGQQGLAGGVREWVLDYYSESYYQEPTLLDGCNDCANLVLSNARGLRGGRDSACCGGVDTLFWVAARGYAAPGANKPPPNDRYQAAYGARCARDVP
jgi:formylglycine-generating enzyme required for sulfatase activity